MLFNSAVFIIGFLPVVWLGFYVLTASHRVRWVGVWLCVCSLAFYGWWDVGYLPLLVGSILFNYLVGGYLLRKASRPVLVFGVVCNLLLLGYYKYTVFLVGSAAQAFGRDWAVDAIVLPLAISFFTFQQIAYLSDAHDGLVKEHDFVNYALFISFFPQLIAGPITHHREMIEQFNDPARFRPRLDLFALGVTVFLVGLFKKVVLADPMGEMASPLFAAAAAGSGPALQDAWAGALSYTLQIYFDFSGYSDMAIGLGLLFGISLPQNFDSPYKARNVIEFWSRWHMTLTRFLTTYVYNPVVLGITRLRVAAGKPQPRRGKMSAGAFVMLVAYPTLLTMFLSGVWHGAGWQFLIFGLLHGAFLVVAHGWRALKARHGWKVDSDVPWHRMLAIGLTFVCVVVAMVFFRAADVPTALRVLAGMAGLNGYISVDPVLLALEQGYGRVGPTWLQQLGRIARADFTPIVLLLFVVWGLPNTQQWMRHYPTALNLRVRAHWLERFAPVASWRPVSAVGVGVGVFGFMALARAFSAAPTEFLYFQF